MYFAKEDFNQGVQVFISLDGSVFKCLHQGIINTLIALFSNYRYIHKIIKFTICNTVFFTSGGDDDDDVLVTLSLL